MSSFIVTVIRLGQRRLDYFAIGTDSAAVHLATLERFGACGVSVRPAGARP